MERSRDYHGAGKVVVLEPGQQEAAGLFGEEAEHVWQHRFFDFNVWSERKRIEKLRYMHRNPVKEGLVAEPEQWAWSSFRSYAYGEQIDSPPLQKTQRWATHGLHNAITSPVR